MQLVNLANSPEEAKEQGAICTSEGEGPKYPYGLCLDLNDDVLEKLGITSLPPVGTVMHITAMAKVTRVSEHENEKESERCVGLQITDMAATPGPAQASAPRSSSDMAKSLYG